MSVITKATPIDAPYTRPDGLPGIARSGITVELDCGHSFTGNPIFDYKVGSSVNCSECREIAKAETTTFRRS